MGEICSKKSEESDFRESYNSDIRPVNSKRNRGQGGLLPKQEQFIRFYEQHSLFSCRETREYKDASLESFLRDPELQSFIAKLQSSRESFQVYLCAILLSRGNNREKAQILIRLFNFKHLLSIEHIRFALLQCFEVAVDFCPLLAYEHYSGDCIQEREIMNYRNILKTQKEVFINEVIRDIKEMNSHSFEDLLCNSDLQFILDPQKLRERILTNYMCVH